MDVRRRTWLVVVGGPLVITGLAFALAWGIRSQLPDPVAVHWGTDGPNGFAGPTAAALLTLIGAPSGILVGALVAAAAGNAPGFRRTGGGLAWGLAAFVSGLSTALLWGQRGLTDAADAGSPTLAIFLALVAALALGALGASLTPGSDPALAVARGDIPTEAVRADLPAGEAVTWSRWAVGGSVILVVALLQVPILALAVVGIVPWFALVLTGSLLLVVAAFTAFRVSVERSGLVVASVLGWPRFDIPLAQVAEASVTQVRPMQDFGGWGLRGGRGGRFGVVVRAGEGLSVRRGDGTVFVVTVDDAAQAAGLLNTLAERQRATSD